jgi:LPS sulfotransferase NodH
MSENSPRLNFVCVLAVPRTGSSHLCHLLHSCPGINMKSELFHPKGVHLVNKRDHEVLRTISNGEITDNPSLCQWRAAHPGATLEALHESGGKRPLVFKLFGSHVARELVAEEIFSREDTGYIVLRRRPIESYISGLKARTVATHGRVDTTEIKPEADPERFVKWANYVQRWYAWIDEQIAGRGLPVVRMSYETHLKSVPPQEALQHTLAALEEIGFPHFDAGRKLYFATQQDREERYQDRVSNWDAFVETLRAKVRPSKLLDWAEQVH